eukprot:TRINITY_DN6704_c0_g1_i1.p1 TRINITY_DN6704_c0_g1~~TRINITY_DN6704_c0_g1_i1.p1  ORF type:complete len:309 (-),score=37.47 TRINITY_DN6704_c0_g1_i1:11-937(-)
MYSTIENESSTNKFRDVEKKYRVAMEKGRKNRVKEKTTDFTGVIDFTYLDHNSEENKKLINVHDVKEVNSKYFGNIKKIYSVSRVPGLYFIPNPFTAEQQRFWIHKCLKCYTIGNPTNLSNLNKTPYWDSWQQEHVDSLRWASLGYHYQWTPRVYDENIRGSFPKELSELVSEFAQVVDQDIDAEAAIINFYPHTKCQMGAHVDDSEDDMTKPIVSVSFGNTVVFLIGGRTREVEPVALFIRSGDVVIMGGESRYSFHAVPRMIMGSVPEDILNTEGDSTVPPDWENTKEYISQSRINMNCRQVRKKS